MNDSGLEQKPEDALPAQRKALARSLSNVSQAWARWKNWRSHVRAHPWAATGGVGALGLALGLRLRRKRMAPSLKSEPGRPSILGRLLGFVATALQLAFTAWLQQTIASRFEPVARKEPEVPDSVSQGTAS